MWSSRHIASRFYDPPKVRPLAHWPKCLRKNDGVGKSDQQIWTGFKLAALTRGSWWLIVLWKAFFAGNKITTPERLWQENLGWLRLRNRKVIAGVELYICIICKYDVYIIHTYHISKKIHDCMQDSLFFQKLMFPRLFLALPLRGPGGNRCFISQHPSVVLSRLRIWPWRRGWQRNSQNDLR